MQSTRKSLSASSNTLNSNDKVLNISLPPKNPRDGCCWQGTHFFNALKAVATRMLFMFHAMLIMWRVSQTNDSKYWALSASFALLIGETILILFKRRGIEWKWFQWSVLFYLLSVLPGVWVLELQVIGRFIDRTPTTIDNNGTQLELDVEGSKVSMSDSQWTVILEQSILVVIILARWLMPKGDLSRDQLSSLLLVHLGTASDIVDFLTLLTEINIMKSPLMTYAILSMWSWCFCQFPFVVTATKEKEEEDIEELELREEDGVRQSCRERMVEKVRLFVETEIWGILVSVLMQDGPFVVIRLTSVVNYSVVSYSNYFFLCKNTMVLMLQLYRVYSLYEEVKKKKKENQKEAQQAVKMKKLYENLAWEAEAKGITRSISKDSAV